jgi:molecular chaperone DnaK
MTITGGSALSKEDIERMMKDAESHAEEDKKRREEAEVRNNGDSLVYQTEKFINENREKLSEGEGAAKLAETETALADLKKLLEGADYDGIKSATDKLAQLSQALGAALYAANAASAPQGGNSGNDEGIQDAEVVEE